MKKNLNFISWPMITFNGVDQILHTLNIIIIHTHGFFKWIIIYIIKYNVPYLCIITCIPYVNYIFHLICCFVFRIIPVCPKKMAVNKVKSKSCSAIFHIQVPLLTNVCTHTCWATLCKLHWTVLALYFCGLLAGFPASLL